MVASKRTPECSPELERSQPARLKGVPIPDLQDLEAKKTFSLTVLINRGFGDPNVVSEIAPTLMQALKPAIAQTVEATIAAVIPGAIQAALDCFKNDVISSLAEQTKKQ